MNTLNDSEPSRTEKRAPDLTDVVLSAMPGWRFEQPPRPFGWAPDRHFRALLACGDRHEPVVIRQSWSGPGFEVERYLYTQILPDLPVNTPLLLASFRTHSHDTGWLVLRDVGQRCADQACPHDRQRVLLQLGALHGHGIRLTRSGRLAGSPLPQFPPSHWHYQGWEDLVRFGVCSSQHLLPAWATDFTHLVREKAAAAEVTLLHGDTDYSNAVVGPSGLSLVDWERACIGPASADLGRALEPTGARPDDLKAYHGAYQEALHADISLERTRQEMELAVSLNSLRWICYYLKRLSEGDDPGESWRDSYFVPSLRMLESSRETRQTWSGT